MSQLRLVHVTEDGGGLLVETEDGLQRFVLPVDAVLRSALRTGDAAAAAAVAAPVVRAAPDTRAPSLGPREIQMRVRAGESPEHLAEAVDAGVESILRFAAPVMAERARIADEARRARARRTSNDSVVVVFGEAVDERFEAHGISATTVTWDAWRRDDGEWVVAATWLGGNDNHTAEWLFHRSSRTVTPADETAVDLLSDAPIRPIVPPQDDRPARHKLREAPPLVPGVVAFPPMPDAYTGPVPVVDDVFDQEAEPEGPRDVPPLRPTGTRLESVPTPPADVEWVPVAAVDTVDDVESVTGNPVQPVHVPAEPGLRSNELDLDTDRLDLDTGQLDLGPDRDYDPAFEADYRGGYDELPLPLTLDGQPAARRVPRDQHTDAERAERSRIPSWDDILLGVRRKSD